MRSNARVRALERRQYPWLALGLATFGLAVAGNRLSGIGVVGGYPFLVGSGPLVASRPELFGCVTAAFGTPSPVIAGFLAPDGSSLLDEGAVVAAGVGALVGGAKPQ